MKTAYLALLAGVLMLSAAEAGDKTMSKRVTALMSALNVEEASNKALPSRKERGVSVLKFKKTESLRVSHRQGLENSENDTEDELIFSNDKGEPKAFGKIKIEKQPRPLN